MVDFRVCNFHVAGAGAAVGSICSWRTPLQNEHRRSVRLIDFGPNNFLHGSPSQIQRISASSCCNSLRLGAAEEGESSWKDKLESTSTRKGDILEGESNTALRDRIVDEEGNIDNVEQEQTRTSFEEEAASERWLCDQGSRCLDDVIFPDDMLARDQDRSQHMHDVASRFNCSAQTMDWTVMAETGPNVPLSSTTKLWLGEEDGINEGDKGESFVGDVHVYPSHSRGEVSPSQVQECEKYGWSEATWAEGSLSRSDPHEHGEGKTMEDDKLQQEEEEVFQEDEGRTPDDYQRRADLFGKSGEQFVAQKQRDERKNL